MAAGTWESSTLAPIAIPATRAANHSLPATDMLAGINTELYSNIWLGGIPPTTAMFLTNMTKWNWVLWTRA